MTNCTEKCWTATPCPEHGNLMPPFGRDNAGTACCDNYAKHNINFKRHLWDQHDSTRWYSDPHGWTQHEQHCNQCNPTGEDDD